MAVINSYYSNLIEGNRTLPHEIRAAQHGAFSDDPAKRDLQCESLAHIQVQDWLAAQAPDLDTLYSPAFIQAIHREFYQAIPASLHELKDSDGKVIERVVPGQWRSRDVTVGRHHPPAANAIAGLMQEYCEVYHPAHYRGDRKVIAVMCAHHRLAWLHPFADGNGRVMRLFTDAALKAIGMESEGIWCLSRGLARRAADYKAMLARADQLREGDLDGRGQLSQAALMGFCEFMLDTALDQVQYMSELLMLDNMQDRITKYIQARNDGRVAGLGGIKEVAGLILYNAFVQGKLKRALALELCGMPERSARRLLEQLKDEGLLSETSSRSDLYWEIPEHAEPWYFPLLTPGN
jgi:Fic family protein